MDCESKVKLLEELYRSELGTSLLNYLDTLEKISPNIFRVSTKAVFIDPLQSYTEDSPKFFPLRILDNEFAEIYPYTEIRQLSIKSSEIVFEDEDNLTKAITYFFKERGYEGLTPVYFMDFPESLAELVSKRAEKEVRENFLNKT